MRSASYVEMHGAGLKASDCIENEMDSVPSIFASSLSSKHTKHRLEQPIWQMKCGPRRIGFRNSCPSEDLVDAAKEYYASSLWFQTDQAVAPKGPRGALPEDGI